MWRVPAPVALLALLALESTRTSDVPQIMVQNWARSFGNMISTVCELHTTHKNISNAYQRGARVVEVDGMVVLTKMANDMINMMNAKTDAVKRIVDTAEIAAMSHREKAQLDVFYYNAKKLNEFDGKNLSTLREGYNQFVLGNASKHFNGIPVNLTHSTVHVPTNVFDKSMEVNNTIAWSEALNMAFTSNFKLDPSLSWQYFGSSTGIMRQYPGVKWLVDPNEPDMFDCRMREWYIRAASSPKDVIILLDLSGSMTGLRVEIAKHVVLNILDTLNTNDYVNIYNFSQAAQPPLVPCFNNTLVQANLENIRIFKDRLENITTHGLANFTLALTEAFEVLTKARENNESSQCNQVIMLVTDGAPDKFQEVFNTYNRPNIRVRVFTYLIGRDVADREAVEWMACTNKGYFTHVTAMAEVREQVQKYIPVLARPLVLSSVVNESQQGGHFSSQHPVIWTGVYADIADPKLTDWLWEIRERERQYRRSKNYQELLRRSTGPGESSAGAQCYEDMQNFLTYGVEKLNKSEREMKEAEMYRETKLDLRERDLSDKWTLHIGMTDSETTQRGYRLVTSIAMPVFDRLKEPRNVTEKVFVNNTQWVYRTQEKKVARLLGVAGTDVPLSDIQKHAPPYRLGVNGYSFIIDNNGYILYHPDMRPVHREATKQFQEILKPTYKTVDLAEVEIVDVDQPRFNHSKLFELRKGMIDGSKAQHSIQVRQHLDNMKRVIKRRQKYFYTPLRPTPFSLAIVLPEGYGKKRIRGEVELTQAAKHGERRQILEYFAGPNWSVHPEWVYCEYDNDAHSLDTPRSQYLHFLEKAMSTPGFEWRSQRLYPVEKLKEAGQSQYRTGQREEKTYFCDRELFQSVVFDAKVTMQFKFGRGQYDSAEQFRTFGALHSFVATRSGFTRWKTYLPDDAQMTIEPDNLRFTAVRATDEIWYKRAVDYYRNDSNAFVYSVPFDAGLRNDSLVTVAQAVFVNSELGSSPAAVVGMQFLHSKFREKFLSTASCPSLEDCEQTCASDSLDCYLLDDSGFVLVSKRHEETGKFFGDVDGTVMDALLHHNVYHKVLMFDYQGVCLDVIPTGSSAWTLLTPLKYLQYLVSWVGSKLLWLLVQSSLLHLYDINLAWAAERSFGDYTDPEMPGVQNVPPVVTDENGEEVDHCYRVSNEQLFKMAHIAKTKPRPCDKRVYLYTLSQDARPVKASMGYCHGIGNTSCSRGFVLERVPLTNMLLLVVNALCPCENQRISIEPQEVDYPPEAVCERLLLEPYRRRPANCTHYHVKEESLDEMCGRSSAAPLAVSLLSSWLLAGIALLTTSRVIV
ncbi:voltage-dependent calcium channel subunit alpha-2/delta-3-like isoform X3 [Amphibalanus amphitrite]|uniref:voltage-dependent calcium channel subunit alpha-2/delta-3-like isoform X3 n=1 Tax=Amphibalanus amphitrite TaxID=1232801 RepID=UPI001C910CF8|nr:voltage-dependent calcium channel subunit alpha-2/delta-3-like isoform X3 [Amphibalanus amphitrite]